MAAQVLVETTSPDQTACERLKVALASKNWRAVCDISFGPGGPEAFFELGAVPLLLDRCKPRGAEEGADEAAQLAAKTVSCRFPICTDDELRMTGSTARNSRSSRLSARVVVVSAVHADHADGTPRCRREEVARAMSRGVTRCEQKWRRCGKSARRARAVAVIIISDVRHA